MKRLNVLFISLALLFVFTFMANPASAFEFNFYYQEIEEVYDPASTAPWLGLGQTVSNWFGNEKVEIKKSEYVPTDSSPDKGHAQIAYKIRTRKVTCLAELYNAMGVTQEQINKGEVSNGQLALIDTFKEAQSKAIQDRTEHAFKNKCDVYLTDSSDYDTNPNVSDYVKNALKKDFWPCSSGDKKRIQMSSRFFCGDADTDHAVSTFVHEYSHSLDKTEYQEKNHYGLDNTHYYDEIISKSAAFKESWAEYNEMIEFDSTRDSYLSRATANTMLSIESTSKSGDYSNKIKASDATAEQLMCNEMFMCSMLYKLHELLGEDANGKDIVSNAFYETNGKNNSMSNLIKQIIKDNPSKIADIIKVVDDATLNKMKSDYMREFFGDSQELENYITNNNVDARGSETTGSVGENAARRAKPSSENDTQATDTLKKTSIFKRIADKIKSTLKITSSSSSKLPTLKKLSDETENNKGKGVVIEVESDDPFGE